MTAILNDGIIVELGGREYTIRPLTIDKDLEWRKAVGKFTAEVVRTMDSRDPRELMARAAEMVSGEGMDTIVNSMFLLDGWEDLDISQISRLELTRAATAVYSAHYAPFVSALVELALSLAPN
jgi:hypothetical protein